MRDEHDTITEAITTLIEPWQGPLLSFSGPVREQDVAWAEQELRVKFPTSYRAFLKRYGSGRVHYYRLLGLRGNCLWDDVVAVNLLAVPRGPGHLVRVAETPDEHTFHLDTALTDEGGECPVRAFGPGAAGRIIAASFLEFLSKICGGLAVGEKERARG